MAVQFIFGGSGRGKTYFLQHKIMEEAVNNPKKDYIMMACMMGGGIGLCAAGAFPDTFVAFFYSGLGCALALAGVVFARNYLCYHNLMEREQEA